MNDYWQADESWLCESLYIFIYYMLFDYDILIVKGDFAFSRKLRWFSSFEISLEYISLCRFIIEFLFWLDLRQELLERGDDKLY